MNDILFKIPMKPEHFKTWIEAPLRKAAGQASINVAARSIKGGRILGLFAYFYDQKDGSYVRFRNKPQDGDANAEGEIDIYRRTNSLSETLALFEDLFLKDTPPGGKDWLPSDDTINRLDEACYVRAFIDTKVSGLRGSESDHSPDALKALKAQDFEALDAVFDSGLEPSDCRVPESRAKKAIYVPVLAQYFKETKSLAFTVDAIKLFAKRGYRLQQPWIGSDAEVRRFRRQGSSLPQALLRACHLNPLGYGVAEARALARHCNDPQFIAVWKALLDTELPFVHAKQELDWWILKIGNAFGEACTELRSKGQSEGVERLFLASAALRYLIRGIPYENLGDLSAVAGRTLSRVLHAADFGGMESADRIILDFEGIFVTAENGSIGCTDLDALSNFPESIDASDRYAKVIGKRVAQIQFSCRETTKNRYHTRQTFVFEDGTLLILYDNNYCGHLRVLEPDWGGFRVSPNGVLEKQLQRTPRFADIYGEEFWHHEDTERLLEIAKSNPLFDAYLDGAFDEWVWTRRKSHDFHSWKNVAASSTNKNSITAIWKLVGRWLKSPVPESGLARKMLPCTYATDRGLAAHELEDMPEVFAKELGLVWPNPEDHYAVKNYEEGIRLTKPVEEANAIAKAYGWWISFEEDPISLRRTLLR